MRRVRKDLGKAISGTICISMTAAFVLTACTVNIDRLNQGLSELGDSISSIAETKGTSEITTEDTSLTEPTVSVETTESEPSVTPEPTATPVPTATSAPTPTPAMERVDFSNLSQDEIGNEFTVDKEDFSQTGLDESENVLVTYEGNTLRVECGNKSIQEAINLILGSFAKRADGIYDFYYQKALANVALTGLAEETYAISQEMSYSDNGRLLSVIMRYSAGSGDGIIEEYTDYATFDMLTGQYVTLGTIASDTDGLKALLGEKLIYAFENPEGVPDDEGGNKRSDNKKNAHEAEVIFIAAQKPGAETATAEVYGTVDGNLVHATIDMKAYAEMINSYGRIVFLIDG